MRRAVRRRSHAVRLHNPLGEISAEPMSFCRPATLLGSRNWPRSCSRKSAAWPRAGSLCGRRSDDNRTTGVSSDSIGGTWQVWQCRVLRRGNPRATPCLSFPNPAPTASTRTRRAQIAAPMKSPGIATTGCCRCRSKRTRTGSTMPTPASPCPSSPRNGTRAIAPSRSSCARTRPFTTGRRSRRRTSNGRSTGRWRSAAIPGSSSAPARSPVRSRPSSSTITRSALTTTASTRSCCRTSRSPFPTCSIPS